MKDLKIGDYMIQYFHFMGVKSEDKVKIQAFDDETVTIGDGDEDDKIFNRKTGKCLNDNNFGGAYRTIDPC